MKSNKTVKSKTWVTQYPIIVFILCSEESENIETLQEGVKMRNLLSKNVRVYANALFYRQICIRSDPTSLLFDGLIRGDRAALAKSITLVETTNEAKKELAQNLLNKTLEYLKEKRGLGKQTFRIGLHTSYS